ncbi:hypothetical protein GCM10009853_029270 [Glycomyces scopariae]|uniref:Uncharacterized protein n=1 Tax=Glycomyces sambucus TaxID=380244 RepID=A0A1G9FVV7_9ACTN|nr:hypothetical protein [Glycomyces sambucus]SDK92283.1 hypothetical protein SAMN05216298_2049 [Glycomyces sambucus]
MDEEFGAGPEWVDLVSPLPDWEIDSERSRVLASLVSVTANEQLGAVLNAPGPEEGIMLARGAGQRVRERLFDSVAAADCLHVFDLVVHVDKVTAALAGPAPDLDRWAEQVRYFVDHLNRIADRAYPRPGQEV